MEPRRIEANGNAEARALMRRLVEAGLRSTVVERCPAPNCDVCSRRLRPAA